jgi:hypothetical protein
MASFDFSNPPTISRAVGLTIYSRSALAATQAAFREHCRISTALVAKDRLLVSVMPLMTAPEEVRTMLLEFWNYFLDRSCQEKLRQGKG